MSIYSWWVTRKARKEADRRRKAGEYDPVFSKKGTGTVKVNLPPRYRTKAWESSLYGFAHEPFFLQTNRQFKPDYFEDKGPKHFSDSKYEGWTWRSP